MNQTYLVRKGHSRRSFLPVLSVLVVLSLMLVPLSASAAPTAKPVNPPLANKVIFFAADGMRPDLMEKFAGEGAMPTYAQLMAEGVRGVNGLVQAFPPNTGVGWYSLATGTYQIGRAHV